jgi:class 3 adenylate cyclase
VRAHGGREVKTLGDGLMVAFADPGAATSCAQAMQRLAADARHAIRIGVATGEVVHEEGDYFGRAVVIARRLCDAAGSGETLLCPDTTRGSGTAMIGHAVPAGALVLKGLSQPVSASLLRAPLLAGSA